MKKFNVAIVGATGIVGEELCLVLDEFDFPINRLIPIASANSVGIELEFKGQTYKVKELSEDIFKKEEVDIAFFSAGGAISEHYAKFAIEAGAIVIDNTSHFRLFDNVPLVVPECNSEDIAKCKESKIIANPNCSTIQMVQILKPLDELFDIKRVDVATYQAVSGAGKEGVEELIRQLKNFFDFKLDESISRAFQHQIALNVIPHIDQFCDNGYTKEEMKMILESQKILHKNIEINATCVRIPVLRSHSEAISIHCNNAIDLQKAKEAIINAPGLVLEDDIKNNIYPMPLTSSGKDSTFVGRMRVDNFQNNILHLWCSADQVRVGAATNAVKIALEWIKNYH